MTDRYALVNLDERRWDDDTPIEGDCETIADAVGLLAQVRYAWGGFVSVFVFSEDDFRSGLIRREPWAKALRWLKAVEDMARGLLLVMALALPARMRAPPRMKSAPKTQAKAPPEAQSGRKAYPNRSLSVVDWLIEAKDGRGPSGKADGDGAPGWRLANRWHRIRGLVCRTEALLRILNDPAPFARRVARRLDGLNQPLRFPDYPPPREAPLVGRNGDFPEPPRPNPYRFILAPLWAHIGDLWVARESPG